jgi:protein TonB
MAHPARQDHRESQARRGEGRGRVGSIELQVSEETLPLKLQHAAEKTTARTISLSILRACFLVSLWISVSVPLAAQERIKVSEETAASRLIKKVEPEYPAFAKAVGIEGTVRLHVGIGMSGRIGSLMETTGPLCLYEAAKDAILQYVYKPFEQGGKAVAADTTVTVIFKLNGNTALPLPPPKVSSADFSGFGRFVRSGETHVYRCDVCVTDASATLRKWLAEELRNEAKAAEDGSESSPEVVSVEKQVMNAVEPLPETIELVEAPVKESGVELYILRLRLAAFCGATGNCPIKVIEADSAGPHKVAEDFGGA